MDRFAICVNDAELAGRLLAPLLAAGVGATQCLLVLCPPRLGRRVGRHLTTEARQCWRDDWATGLRDTLAPLLARAVPGARFDWVTAHDRVEVVTRRLRQQHGAGLRLLDARLAPLGAVLEPMTAGQTPATQRLTTPVAVASSLSLMLALTD